MLQASHAVLAQSASISSTCTDPSEVSRRRRVTWAILAIVLFSLADLYFTLLYARTVGMSEANPIARAVMSLNSPALLSLWKCASVGLACLIFWFFRHRRLTEMAAFACTLVLGALIVWWAIYAHELPRYASSFHTMAQGETNWVQFGD